MQIIRITDRLPPELTLLATAASAEGVRNLGLLATEWACGVQRFSGEGEALFAALIGGDLAGVGGVSREPWPGVDAMRMRRFYVSPSRRRSGVGRALAEAAMQQGLQSAPMLTLNARASAAAAPFWEALRFSHDERNGWTHVLRPLGAQISFQTEPGSVASLGRKPLLRRVGWDESRHPFNLPVVRRTHAIRFHSTVTYRRREGSGKSTLIEAVAVALGFNAES